MTSSLSKNVWWGVISPFQRLRVKNMSVKIGLIELTEPPDTLNYKPFFKHCILQTILHEFLLFIFVWKIYFVLRTESYFTFFFLFGLRWHLVVQY